MSTDNNKSFDVASMLGASSNTPEKAEENTSIFLGESTKRKGRPPVKEKDKRKERIVCYVTKDELSKLEELAESESLNMSNFARKIMLGLLK